MLEMLGLTSHAQVVYQKMLAEPGFGIAELCAGLDLAEAQVRTALDELADLTLVRASRERSGLLRAVSPAAGLDLILGRQEADLARRQQELAANRAAAAHAVARFSSLRTSPDPDGSIRLVGLDAVYEHLETLTRQVTGEILSVTPGAAIPPDTLDSGRANDAEVLSRGVALRILYQDSVRNDPATFSYASWLTNMGGQVRTAPLLPPRLLVYDRTTALVSIDPVDTTAGALCTREPGIVAPLIALFEQAWDSAIPLGADQIANSETGLTSAERYLLKLLAGGMTDEAAAKRLGVSLRTVRRHMAALMERLGAASRFEAGLKAAQRGWL